VRYTFNHSEPVFDDITLVVELPDQDYVPDTPCWTIDILEDGTSSITSNQCPA
jgi:hypothetical protein